MSRRFRTLNMTKSGVLNKVKAETGTTLVELLIYMVIILVILGGAYVIYDGAEAIYKSTSEQADAQRSARVAQLSMTRHLRMTQSFVTANDYAIDIRADINDDNLWETVSYYVQGDRLYRRVDGGVARELARGVQNIAQSHPMFIYYDSYGSSITTDTASRKTKTRQIEVKLLIDLDIGSPPDVYTLSSKVTPRNQD